MITSKRFNCAAITAKKKPATLEKVFSRLFACYNNKRKPSPADSRITAGFVVRVGGDIAIRIESSFAPTQQAFSVRKSQSNEVIGISDIDAGILVDNDKRHEK
jgi:hypothetical protein